MISKMQDLNLKDKTILIRQDLNVPIENGIISSSLRIEASLPTIKTALEAGAGVLIASHLGRPEEGKYDSNLSLAPVAAKLSELLGQKVELVKDYLTKNISIKAGEVKLLENVRFNIGEKSNSEELAQKYARLCDVFIMDAFATAHRAQASTSGVANFASQKAAGILLTKELDALKAALQAPKTPLIALVGGSKVSTKLAVLEALTQKCDLLITGGGIANTFLAAAGYKIGMSLFEAEQIQIAKELLKSGKIPLPIDLIVSKTFAGEKIRQVGINEVEADDIILDIGEKTIADLSTKIENANTILWNGPLGLFENSAFAKGTEAIAHAIGASQAFSIAGGGDTLAAIDKFGVKEKISYISTGGGAFLEFVEGKQLPGLTALS